MHRPWWKHGSPDAFASGESELAARDYHARYARLNFLAGTQRHEVAIVLLHAFDDRFIGRVERSQALARLHDVECIRQPLLQIGCGDPRTSVPEGFRNESSRRVRLAMMRLPQVANIAGFDAVAGIELAAELGRGFLHTHTIPLRTDFDIHTVVSDETDKFDLSRTFAPRDALMRGGRQRARSRGKAHRDADAGTKATRPLTAHCGCHHEESVRSDRE